MKRQNGHLAFLSESAMMADLDRRLSTSRAITKANLEALSEYRSMRLDYEIEQRARVNIDCEIWGAQA